MNSSLPTDQANSDAPHPSPGFRAWWSAKHPEIVSGGAVHLILTIPLSLLALLGSQSPLVKVIIGIGVPAGLVIWWIIYKKFASLKHEKRELEAKLEGVQYAKCFDSESAARNEIYEKLFPSVPPPNARRLTLVGLCNSSVFTWFRDYAHFVEQGGVIEVVSLDVEAEYTIRMLENDISRGPLRALLGEITATIEHLPIEQFEKTKLRECVANPKNGTLGQALTQACFHAWRLLADKFERGGADPMHSIQFYAHKVSPSLKAMLIDETHLFRGDYAIPGCSLPFPFYYYEKHINPKAFEHVRAALDMIKSSNNIRKVDLSRKGRQAPEVFDPDCLSNSFYESSGHQALEAALSVLQNANAKTVVDLGAGTDRIAHKIAKIVGKEGCVIAVEKSRVRAEAIHQAVIDKRLDYENSAEIIVICADAANLDEFLHEKGITSKVDLIFCRHALHHFMHPTRVLEQIANCLRPNGVLLLIDILAPADEVPRNELERLARVCNGDHTRYYTSAEILEMLSPNFVINGTELKTFSDYVIRFNDYYLRARGTEKHIIPARIRDCLSGISIEAREQLRLVGQGVDDSTMTLSDGLFVVQRRPLAGK